MSSLLANLAAILAPVLLISAAGFIWVKRGYAFDQAFATNVIAILSAPSLVFSTLVRMHVSGQNFAVMGEAALLCLALSFAFGALALRLTGLSYARNWVMTV